MSTLGTTVPQVSLEPVSVDGGLSAPTRSCLSESVRNVPRLFLNRYIDTKKNLHASLFPIFIHIKKNTLEIKVIQIIEIAILIRKILPMIR